MAPPLANPGAGAGAGSGDVGMLLRGWDFAGPSRPPSAGPVVKESPPTGRPMSARRARTSRPLSARILSRPPSCASSAGPSGICAREEVANDSAEYLPTPAASTERCGVPRPSSKTAENELRRLATLVEGLLRDVALMKDSVWNLEKDFEEHKAQTNKRFGQCEESICRAKVAGDTLADRVEVLQRGFPGKELEQLFGTSALNEVRLAELEYSLFGVYQSTAELNGYVASKVPCSAGAESQFHRSLPTVAPRSMSKKPQVPMAQFVLDELKGGYGSDPRLEHLGGASEQKLDAVHSVVSRAQGSLGEGRRLLEAAAADSEVVIDLSRKTSTSTAESVHSVGDPSVNFCVDFVLAPSEAARCLTGGAEPSE